MPIWRVTEEGPGRVARSSLRKEHLPEKKTRNAARRAATRRATPTAVKWARLGELKIRGGGASRTSGASINALVALAEEA